MRPAPERRHRRVAVRMQARIESIDAERDPAGGDRWFRLSEETCTNVSRGGALLVSPEPLLPGGRLLVDLELPDGERVQKIGRVAWSRITPSGSGCACDSGIEFLESDADATDRLDEYLRALAPEDC